MPKTVIGVGANRIYVTHEKGGGSINSDLHCSDGVGCCNCDDSSCSDCQNFNAAVDGLESLLLAIACTGVDISTPEFQEAITTAYNAIDQNYGN